MSGHEDWRFGVKPTPEEIAEQIAHIRGYVQECTAIAGELFPDTPNPARQTAHYQLPTCRHGWPTEDVTGACPARCTPKEER